MFGSFTNKISQFLLKKMQNSKNQEINEFIQQLLDELRNILISDDVHPSLVDKIIQDNRDYLTNNKQEIFDNKNLMRNLLKNILSKYIIEDKNFQFKKNIILIGDNGNGKTTIASKLSCYLRENLHKKIAIIHHDPFRYGSYEQLVENLENTDIPVYKMGDNITNEYDYFIIDTAGYSSWTDEYKKTLNQWQDNTYIYVGSCLMGNSSFLLIEKIMTDIKLDGIIITNCDGESRSGLFLSASYLIKKPVLFISDNEIIESDGYNPAIIAFDKESLLKRLLGLYDETGFQEAVDNVSKKNSGLMNKLFSGVFDYDTMEEILEGMVKNKFNGLLGSLGNMQIQNPQQKVMMKKMLLIVQSMTRKEKIDINLLEGETRVSRLNRIARGCNMNINEVAMHLQALKAIMNTFKNFSQNGLNDLGNLQNIDEIKDKMSNPEFLKKYINEDDILAKNNLNFNENATINNENNYNINMSNEVSNDNNQGGLDFGNNLEAIKMIKKQFTAQQFVNLLQNIPVEMLKSMPGMENIDPAVIKSISVEQIQMLYDSID